MWRLPSGITFHKYVRRLERGVRLRLRSHSATLHIVLVLAPTQAQKRSFSCVPLDASGELQPRGQTPCQCTAIYITSFSTPHFRSPFLSSRSRSRHVLDNTTNSTAFVLTCTDHRRLSLIGRRRCLSLSVISRLIANDIHMILPVGFLP